MSKTLIFAFVLAMAVAVLSAPSESQVEKTEFLQELEIPVRDLTPPVPDALYAVDTEEVKNADDAMDAEDPEDLISRRCYRLKCALRCIHLGFLRGACNSSDVCVCRARASSIKQAAVNAEDSVDAVELVDVADPVDAMDPVDTEVSRRCYNTTCALLCIRFGFLGGACNSSSVCVGHCVLVRIGACTTTNAHARAVAEDTVVAEHTVEAKDSVVAVDIMDAVDPMDPVDPLYVMDAADVARQARINCDLLSGIGWNHTFCAAHCLLLGFRGGACNSAGVCVCRR